MSSEPTLPSLAEIEAAAQVVYRAMPPTPQYRWALLSERLGADCWVKHENHGPVGAFKLRGGLTFFDALARRGQLPREVISATRGNHGQSIGWAARAHGVHCTIVVPRGNSLEKNAAMRALGVELIEQGEDFTAAAEHARRLADERGALLVPSFHRDLVLGVATYWWEFLRAVPRLDVAYVPIGLGSGACAALAARRALGHPARIVGVVSRLAPTYALSLAAGRVVEAPATTRLADGMAVRRADSQALALLAQGLDHVVAVDDAEVGAAMRALHTDTHNLAEGAGAAALAALLRHPERLAGKKVGMVLSGGNIDPLLLAAIIERGMVRSGRLVRIVVSTRDVPGSLARITALVAECGANVDEVHHQRAFTLLAAQNVEIEMVLQTRGHEHVSELVERLRGAGLEVRLVQ